MTTRWRGLFLFFGVPSVQRPRGKPLITDRSAIENRGCEAPLGAPDRKSQSCSGRDEDPVRFKMSSPQLGFLEPFCDCHTAEMTVPLSLSPLRRALLTTTSQPLLSLCPLHCLCPSAVVIGQDQGQAQPLSQEALSLLKSQYKCRYKKKKRGPSGTSSSHDSQVPAAKRISSVFWKSWWCAPTLWPSPCDFSLFGAHRASSHSISEKPCSRQPSNMT